MARAAELDADLEDDEIEELPSARPNARAEVAKETEEEEAERRRIEAMRQADEAEKKRLERERLAREQPNATTSRFRNLKKNAPRRTTSAPSTAEVRSSHGRSRRRQCRRRGR